MPTNLAQAAWIHPYEILGLDPDKEPIDAKAVSRARRRLLADLETGADDAVHDKAAIDKAFNAASENSLRDVLVQSWLDRPLREFLATCDSTSAVRIRALFERDPEHVCYYWSDDFESILMGPLADAVKRATAKLLEGKGEEGVEGLIWLISCDGLVPSNVLMDAASSACAGHLDRLKTLENRLDAKSERPNAQTAALVTSCFRTGFFNALPAEIADVRVKAYRLANGIAVTIGNQFGDHESALAIFEAMVGLELPDAQAEELKRSTIVIRSEAAAARTERLHPKLMAEVKTVTEAIRTHEVKSPDFRNTVTAWIWKIEEMVKPLPTDAKEHAMGNIAMSLRNRSVKVWNDSIYYQESLWLLEKALDLGCGDVTATILKENELACRAGAVSIIKATLDPAIEVVNQIINNGSYANWSKLADFMKKLLSDVENAGMPQGMVPFFGGQTETHSTGKRWIATLRHLNKSEPRIKYILRFHISKYGRGWPNIDDLIGDLGGYEALKKTDDSALKFGYLPLVAVVMLVIITVKCASDGAFQSSTKEPLNTQPKFITAPPSPPPLVVAPTILPPNDYGPTIDGLLRERMTELYYTKDKFPATLVAAMRIKDPAFEKALFDRFTSESDGINRWNLVATAIIRAKSEDAASDHKTALAMFRCGLTDMNPWVRAESVFGIGLIGIKSDYSKFSSLELDPVPEVRTEAIRSRAAYVKRFLPPLPSLTKTQRFPADGIADQSRIYNSLRFKRIIEVVRPNISDDYADTFNLIIGTFNAGYAQFRYNQSEYVLAEARIADDAALLEAQAQEILRQINSGIVPP